MEWWCGAIVDELDEFFTKDLGQIVAGYVPSSVRFIEQLVMWCDVEYQQAQTVFGMVEGRCVGTKFSTGEQGTREIVNITHYVRDKRDGMCLLYVNKRLISKQKFVAGYPDIVLDL